MNLDTLLAFTPAKHIVHTIITDALAIAIFVRGSSIYKKSGNPKMLIFAVACLTNSFFSVIHLVYSVLGDLVYKTDLYYYTQYSYHEIGAITLSVAAVVSALYIPDLKTFSKEKFKIKTYLAFATIFIVGVIVMESIKHFIPYQFEIYSGKFIASNPSLEVLSNALFILAAFIYADILKMTGQKRMSLLPIGFFVLGAGTIYLFNSEFLVSYHRSYVHILRNIGFLLMFMGLKNFPFSISVFNFRQKILAYPALTIVVFSFLYFSACFIFFNIQLPDNSIYVFLILYICTLIFAYSFSLKLSSPITKAIQYLGELKPDEQPAPIDNHYKDEIGLLLEKIKNSAETNWQYTKELKENQLKIQRLNDKEILLRGITEKIRSSLDIEKILEFVCEETAKAFNVQRTSFVTFPKAGDCQYNVVRKEYKSSPTIKGFKAMTSRDDLINILPTYFEESKVFAINNIQDLNFSDDLRKNYSSIGVKSVIGSAIMQEGNLWGVLILSEYYNYRQWTDEEKALLTTITDQLYIAVTQAELYSNAKKQTEAEHFLREIAETIKNSTDTEDILLLICKALTEFLNVLGATIHLFDLSNNKISVLKNYSTNSKLFRGNLSPEVQDYLLNKISSDPTELIVSDLEKYNNNTELKEFLQSKGIKSLFWEPTKEMNNLCYGLCLLDNKTRSWDENETIVIKKVSEYIGKIIIGATLYSKNLFISNVMHELKNPLAAINTFAEAIINRDKEKSELTGNFIVKIKNNVDRLNSIMDNMLFVSSLGAGVEKFGAIKLMEVLNDSIEQINDLASKKNIKILLDTKVELKIYAKKELLSQAFINVLNNAIKYSPCDSNIHINVIKEATEACVSIKDEGCGIDEENQKYIFEPFYRVDKLRSKSTGGTGLGLYITKCIIQKFNGRINCESGLGEGTAFNLHFPLENNL